MFKHLLIWAVKRLGRDASIPGLIELWTMRIQLPLIGRIDLMCDDESLTWSARSHLSSKVISDKDFGLSIGIRWPWNQGGGLGVGLSHDQIRGLRFYTWDLWLATSRCPVQVTGYLDDGIPFQPCVWMGIRIPRPHQLIRQTLQADMGAPAQWGSISL